jgi:hypothetical protein
MTKEKKIKTSEFEKISLTNDNNKLPLTILGLMKARQNEPPKLSLSSYYRTELYYTVAFYKPVSKIFFHSYE